MGYYTENESTFQEGLNGRAHSTMREPTPEEQARIDQLGANSGDEGGKFGWEDSFQSQILGALLAEPDLARKALEIVEPGYFSNEAYVLIAEILKSYRKKYKTHPPITAIERELTDKVKDRDLAVRIHYKGALETLKEHYVPGLHPNGYLLDKLKEFATVQRIKVA
ncbi:MAG TPA: hypothetical protein VJ873_10125 [bacterium]|nr:hypothetical protein [bacterium]